MTRCILLSAALALSACNTSLDPHITAAENKPPSPQVSRDYTWPPPDLVGRPCIGQGPGCYGGIFQPPRYETNGKGEK